MEHCLAWKKSGLSRGQYCAQNNLARTNLNSWLKKYFQEKKENTPPELTEENLPNLSDSKIFLATQSVDFRKSINGLSEIAITDLSLLL
jgi:hypothetical protein